MTPILLPLSKLQEHDACFLPDRIRAFTEWHGFAPDETSTLRQWMEVTPGVEDLLRATRCLPEGVGRRLAVGVAVRAARRVLPIFESKYPTDRRPRRAVELAEKWLADPTSVSVGELRAAADAADAANAAYAACAAYAAYAAYAVNAACAVNAAAAYDIYAYAAERAAQRADFLAILAEIESASS